MRLVTPGSWPAPMLNALRLFNRTLLNPLVMRWAGSRRHYAAVISHTGRRSGKEYRTPVVLEHFSGGFVVPLAYGTGVDWLRNILAAGHARISWRGTDYDVTSPEIVDADEALRLMTEHRRRAFTRFGVEHYLKVTDAS